MDRSSTSTVKQSGCKSVGPARPEKHIRVSVYMCWWIPGFSKKKKKKSWNMEAVVQMEEQVEFGQKKDLVHPPISVDGVTAVQR